MSNRTVRGQLSPLNVEEYREVLEKVRYYPLQRNWTKRVAPHLGDPELNRLLVREFKEA